MNVYVVISDVTQKDFYLSDSYMEWALDESYLHDIDTSIQNVFSYQYISTIQVMFVTRLHNAYLWAAYNYNQMELLRIQVHSRFHHIYGDYREISHCTIFTHFSLSTEFLNSLMTLAQV